MENKELKREESKILNDEGYSFEVEYDKKIKCETTRFFGLLPIIETSYVKTKETFTIKPCTLSTLDRLSKYQIELYLEDNSLTDEYKQLNEAKLMIYHNSMNMARIVAVAVLGTSFKQRKFESLTKILSDSLTPKKLLEIVNQIMKYQDLGNFMNSTRLISMKSVIKPNEVE